VEFRVILIGLQKCKHWRRKIVCNGNPFPSQYDTNIGCKSVIIDSSVNKFYGGYHAVRWFY